MEIRSQKELDRIKQGGEPDKKKYIDLLDKIEYLNKVIEEKNTLEKKQEALQSKIKKLEQEVKKWKAKATRNAGRKPKYDHKCVYMYYKKYGEHETIATFGISRSQLYKIKKEQEPQEDKKSHI